MRAVILALLLSVFIFGFTVVDKCNDPNYAKLVDQIATKAYETYCRDIACPALAPNFYIEVTPEIQYSGLTHIVYTPYGAQAELIQIKCGLGSWVEHVVWHEMAHALQARFLRYGDYGWYTEASAEGLTVYYLAPRDSWFWYPWASEYWGMSLRTKDPDRCQAPNPCAYAYSAPVVWLLYRFGAKNVFPQWAMPNKTYIMESYRLWLLSPWSWGREPGVDGYNLACFDRSVDQNSLLYCEFTNMQPGIVDISSDQDLLINGTFRKSSLFLAIVPLQSYSSLDIRVRFYNCPNVTTVTQTVTKTVTQNVTTTVTKTETVTETVVKPITVTVVQNNTVTVTVRVNNTAVKVVNNTITVTETKVVNYTTTVVQPVTHTKVINVTTTVPVTYTITVERPITVTYVVNNTVTVPVTITRIINKTETYTTTTTIVQPCPQPCFGYDALTIALLIGIAIGAMWCAFKLSKFKPNK